MIENAGIGFYQTGPNGRIRYVNRALARIFGYESEAALIADRPVADVFYADQEDVKRFRRGADCSGRVEDMVFRALRRDGTRIWVKESGGPLCDKSGNIVGYVGSLTDVTELVEARNRLAEAEAGYRRIFERVSEGIYRTSLDGAILRANPALVQLCGYDSEQELLGAVESADELYVDPHRRAAFTRLLDQYGVVEEFESEAYRHRTGERIWVSENAYLVKDVDGNPLYYEGTVRDITERKSVDASTAEALQAAEAANRAKSRFLAHMSHELRTPLNAILGFSEMIRGKHVAGLSPEKIQEYANDINRSGRLLLDLINDVLDLSRIEGEAMPLHIEPVDPAAAIKEALATIQPLAVPKAITFDVECTAETAVLADRRALLQCLLNVVSNAVKFSPDGARVAVRASGDGEILEFQVVDPGQGMSEHLLARIGEPFNTDEAPDHSPTSGTGLGLAITKALLDRMDGQLVIDSIEGAGTTVTLRLPAQVRAG